MKQNPFFVNTLLAIITGIICLAELLIQMLAPSSLLPTFDLPMLAAISLLALTVERYIGGSTQRQWLPTILLGGITLTALPLCVGIQPPHPIWVVFLVGCSVFGVLALLFTEFSNRMSGRFSPLACGLILYLACQCLQGIY